LGSQPVLQSGQLLVGTLTYSAIRSIAGWDADLGIQQSGQLLIGMLTLSAIGSITSWDTGPFGN